MLALNGQHTLLTPLLQIDADKSININLLTRK